MTILANPGAGAATNIGFPAAPTLTVTASDGTDNDMSSVNHANNANISVSTGVISAAFTYARTGWNPKFSAYIKTGPVATSTGYWVGLFSATPDNNAAPNISAAAFRYYTSVDGTAFWRAVTIAGTGASATVTTTGVAVSASTAYRMQIDCQETPLACNFYIGNALVASHTTQVPATSTPLGYAARVTNLAAFSRSFEWSRISVTHN